MSIEERQAARKERETLTIRNQKKVDQGVVRLACTGPFFRRDPAGASFVQEGTDTSSSPLPRRV